MLNHETALIFLFTIGIALPVLWTVGERFAAYWRDRQDLAFDVSVAGDVAAYGYDMELAEAVAALPRQLLRPDELFPQYEDYTGTGLSFTGEGDGPGLLDCPWLRAARICREHEPSR